MWRKSKYTDGPNECGYFTAGIDAQIKNMFGELDWQLHAIEFHSRDKSEAEQRRDMVFGLIVK